MVTIVDGKDGLAGVFGDVAHNADVYVHNKNLYLTGIKGMEGINQKPNGTLINAEKNDLGLNIKLRFYVLISVHHENQRPNSL